jgi:transketolase
MLTAKQLSDIASVLRRDSLEATTAAGSGHASSCLSAADIASVLFFHEMALDKTNPYNPDNDEFVLSKGHAAPLLYAALHRTGLTTQNPQTLRKSSARIIRSYTP